MGDFHNQEDPLKHQVNTDTQFQNQQGIIFLIVLTKEIFKQDLFKKCIQIYQNILKEKCMSNTNDNMGLLLCGTEESDTGIKHVTALQKFSSISVDALKTISNFVENGWKTYQISCDYEFSLSETIIYAMQSILASKTNINNIFLFTLNDNPYLDNASERSRLCYSMMALKDSQIKLRVVGLAKDWNYNTYYKNLEHLAGTFSDNDDYYPTTLNNLEHSITGSYKRICTLPWVFSNAIQIPISIFSTNSRPKYPTKIKLEKENNQIVESRHLLRSNNQNNEDNEFDESDEENIIRNDNLVYYKTYGSADICFKGNECKILKNLGLNPIIQMLACKKVDYDPLFHVSTPNFVTFSKSCTDEGKQFFNMFVNQLEDKNLMAICKVVTKLNVFICQMIPEKESNGFYLYKLPFKDSIRNLNDTLNHYIFNSERRPEINLEAVQLYSELFKHSKVEASELKTFNNPKLEKCIAHIEALALEKNLGELPEDNTVPPPTSDEFKSISNKLKHALYMEEEGERTFDQLNATSKKKNINVEEVARQRELQHLTVAQMKDFLKSINLSSSGTKTILIDRINKHFNL